MANSSTTNVHIVNVKWKTQFANPRRRCLAAPFTAAIVLACTLCSLAQQPDDSPAAKSDAASETAASVTDTPSNDSVETMLLHFKDTRFWLSGQANFIFQTHPPFHAAYSGSNSLGLN